MQLPSSPRLVHYESTDSTSERAFAALADGSAHHGDVHLADHQTAGRGRLGRAWLAGPGEGLLFSIVLLPPAPAPPAPRLTVATCLALLDAVREYGLDAARLKWPNDLLIGREKLCGILLETRGLASGQPHFVVGVGLNVSQKEFPPELVAEQPVTSLRRLGVRADREALLERIWRRLRLRLEQDDARLFADYREALALTGEVVLRSGNDEVRGELVGLDLARGAEVRTASGETVATPLEHVRELGPA